MINDYLSNAALSAIESYKTVPSSNFNGYNISNMYIVETKSNEFDSHFESLKKDLKIDKSPVKYKEDIYKFNNLNAYLLDVDYLSSLGVTDDVISYLKNRGDIQGIYNDFFIYGFGENNVQRDCNNNNLNENEKNNGGNSIEKRDTHDNSNLIQNLDKHIFNSNGTIFNSKMSNSTDSKNLSSYKNSTSLSSSSSNNLNHGSLAQDNIISKSINDTMPKKPTDFLEQIRSQLSSNDKKNVFVLGTSDNNLFTDKKQFYTSKRVMETEKSLDDINGYGTAISYALNSLNDQKSTLSTINSKVSFKEGVTFFSDILESLSHLYQSEETLSQVTSILGIGRSASLDCESSLSVIDNKSSSCNLFSKVIDNFLDKNVVYIEAGNNNDVYVSYKDNSQSNLVRLDSSSISNKDSVFSYTVKSSTEKNQVCKVNVGGTCFIAAKVAAIASKDSISKLNQQTDLKKSENLFSNSVVLDNKKSQTSYSSIFSKNSNNQKSEDSKSGTIRQQSESKSSNKPQSESKSSNKPQSESKSSSNKPQSEFKSSNKPQPKSKSSSNKPQSESKSSNKPQSESKSSNKPQPESKSSSNKPQPESKSSSNKPQSESKSSNKHQSESKSSNKPQSESKSSFNKHQSESKSSSNHQLSESKSSSIRQESENSKVSCTRQSFAVINDKNSLYTDVIENDFFGSKWSFFSSDFYEKLVNQKLKELGISVKDACENNIISCSTTIVSKTVHLSTVQPTPTLDMQLSSCSSKECIERKIKMLQQNNNGIQNVNNIPVTHDSNAPTPVSKPKFQPSTFSFNRAMHKASESFVKDEANLQQSSKQEKHDSIQKCISISCKEAIFRQVHQQLHSIDVEYSSLSITKKESHSNSFSSQSNQQSSSRYSNKQESNRISEQEVKEVQNNKLAESTAEKNKKVSIKEDKSDSNEVNKSSVQKSESSKQSEQSEQFSKVQETVKEEKTQDTNKSSIVKSEESSQESIGSADQVKNNQEYIDTFHEQIDIGSGKAVPYKEETFINEEKKPFHEQLDIGSGKAVPYKEETFINEEKKPFHEQLDIGSGKAVPYKEETFINEEKKPFHEQLDIGSGKAVPYKEETFINEEKKPFHEQLDIGSGKAVPYKEETFINEEKKPFHEQLDIGSGKAVPYKEETFINEEKKPFHEQLDISSGKAVPYKEETFINEEKKPFHEQLDISSGKAVPYKEETFINEEKKPFHEQLDISSGKAVPYKEETFINEEKKPFHEQLDIGSGKAVPYKEETFINEEKKPFHEQLDIGSGKAVPYKEETFINGEKKPFHDSLIINNQVPTPVQVYSEREAVEHYHPAVPSATPCPNYSLCKVKGDYKPSIASSKSLSVNKPEQPIATPAPEIIDTSLDNKITETNREVKEDRTLKGNKSSNEISSLEEEEHRKSAEKVKNQEYIDTFHEQLDISSGKAVPYKEETFINGEKKPFHDSLIINNQVPTPVQVYSEREAVEHYHPAVPSATPCSHSLCKVKGDYKPSIASSKSLSVTKPEQPSATSPPGVTPAPEIVDTFHKQLDNISDGKAVPYKEEIFINGEKKPFHDSLIINNQVPTPVQVYSEREAVEHYHPAVPSATPCSHSLCIVKGDYIPSISSSKSLSVNNPKQPIATSPPGVTPAPEIIDTSAKKDMPFEPIVFPAKTPKASKPIDTTQDDVLAREPDFFSDKFSTPPSKPSPVIGHNKPSAKPKIGYAPYYDAHNTSSSDTKNNNVSPINEGSKTKQDTEEELKRIHDVPQIPLDTFNPDEKKLNQVSLSIGNAISPTPVAEPEVPPSPVSEPEVPASPVAEPEVPALPDAEPEVPASPVAEPEVPPSPVSEPEVPELPVAEPEVPALPDAEPEVPPSPVSEPEVPALPDAEPEVPASPVAEPEVPPSPVSEPEVPALPDAEPEVPELPVAEPEVPEVPELPVAEPEVPASPVAEPEVPASPVAEPEVPASPVAEPEVPPSPVSEPEVPALPDAEPEVPASPVAEPEVPPSPVSEPEVPELPVSEPEVPALPDAEPEVPASPVAEPEVPPSPVSEPEVPELPVSEPEVPALPDAEPEVPASPVAEPEVPPSPVSEPEVPELPVSEPEVPELPVAEPEVPPLPVSESEVPSSPVAESEAIEHAEPPVPPVAEAQTNEPEVSAPVGEAQTNEPEAPAPSGAESEAIESASPTPETSDQEAASQDPKEMKFTSKPRDTLPCSRGFACLYGRYERKPKYNSRLAGTLKRKITNENNEKEKRNLKTDGSITGDGGKLENPYVRTLNPNEDLSSALNDISGSKLTSNDENTATSPKVEEFTSRDLNEEPVNEMLSNKETMNFLRPRPKFHFDPSRVSETLSYKEWVPEDEEGATIVGVLSKNNGAVIEPKESPEESSEVY